jgi:ParB-like nuclease domain
MVGNVLLHPAQHGAEEFRKARTGAKWQRLIAFIQRKPATLPAFAEAQTQNKLAGMSDRGLQEIPVQAIQGSVGRAQDFSASFLPLSDRSAERWARIYQAMDAMESLPPIETYKVGQTYYVIDGHHRVSAAKWMGVGELPAHVIEIYTQ